MFFSGGLIPYAILIKTLGLTNTFLVYVIPGLINIFYMLIMKTLFSSLPPAVEESARIDGCNDLVLFFRIVVPSSMPIIATMALFYGVEQWNAWFDAYLFVNNEKLYPLQTILQKIIIANGTFLKMAPLAAGGDIVSNRVTPFSIQIATMMMSIGPIVLIYPFLQKYYVKGFMLGSIKIRTIRSFLIPLFMERLDIVK